MSKNKEIFSELKKSLCQHEIAAFEDRYNKLQNELGQTVVSASAAPTPTPTPESFLNDINQRIQALTAATNQAEISKLTAAQKFMEEYLAFQENLSKVGERDLRSLEFLQDDNHPIQTLTYRFADGTTVTPDIGVSTGILGVSTGGAIPKQLRVGIPLGASSLDITFNDGQTIRVNSDRSMIYRDNSGNPINTNVYANQILDEYIKKYNEWKANPNGKPAPDIHFNIKTAPPGAHDQIKKHLIQTLVHRYVYDFNTEGPGSTKIRYAVIRNALERGLKLNSSDIDRYQLNLFPKQSYGFGMLNPDARKFAALANQSIEDFVKGDEGKAPVGHNPASAKFGRGVLKSGRFLLQVVWEAPKKVIEVGTDMVFNKQIDLSIGEVGDKLFLKRPEVRSEMTYFLHQLYSDLKLGRPLTDNPNLNKLTQSYKINPQEIKDSLIERVKQDDHIPVDQARNVLTQVGLNAAEQRPILATIQARRAPPPATPTGP